MTFICTVVALNVRIVIFWGAQNLSFGTRGVHFVNLSTMLAARGHSGGPREQQKGHVGVWSKIFIDSGMIWGTHFESLLGSDGLDYILFSGLLPAHLFDRSLNGNPDSWQF